MACRTRLQQVSSCFPVFIPIKGLHCLLCQQLEINILVRLTSVDPSKVYKVLQLPIRTWNLVFQPKRWDGKMFLLPGWEICFNVGSAPTPLVAILLKRQAIHLKVVRQGPSLCIFTKKLISLQKRDGGEEENREGERRTEGGKGKKRAFYYIKHHPIRGLTTETVTSPNLQNKILLF